MKAYYNDTDRFCCDWLSNLMDKGLITPGRIDDRSIVDITGDDVSGYDRVHFFAGIGGWDHALNLAGWNGPVWTGSCPCQPFSVTGKGKAADDERHLWPAWFSLIRECKPAIVFGEQVEAAIGWGWLDAVFAGLEAEGYACGAAVLPACGVGAPHIRQRLWFMGHANGVGCKGSDILQQGRSGSWWASADYLPCTDGKARPVEPGTFPLAHGAPARVVRLRGYGNSLCAPQAQAFIEAYMELTQQPAEHPEKETAPHNP